MKQAGYRVKLALWGLTFILLLVPVQRLIDWYTATSTAEGQPITGPIYQGPVEILRFLARHFGRFCTEFLPDAGLTLLGWTAVFLLFWALATQRLRLPKLENCLQQLAQWINRIPSGYFQTAIALSAVLLGSLISYTLRLHIPDNIDNIAQLFQAKLFLSGKLYTTPPKHYEFFSFPFLINYQGRWYAHYTPGHVALLALGQMFGAPWLINPLLAGGSLIILYHLARRLYGETTARLSCLLMLFSPFFLDLAGDFFNNMSAMFFSLAFLYYTITGLQEGKLYHLFLAGLSLGVVANIRPYTGMLIGLPLAFYLLYYFIRQPKKFLPGLLLMACGLSLPLALLLSYNYLTNGHPLLFGQALHDRLLDKNIHTLGFGQALWGVRHTPFRGLVRMLNMLNRLNDKLYGWPIPSLLFIFLLFLPGRKRHNPWDNLFLAIILTLLGGYFFYFSIKMRYFFSLTPLLAMLTARGLESLLQAREKFKVAGYALLILCWVYMGITYLLPSLASKEGLKKNRVYTLVQQARISNALIFMDPGYANWGIFAKGFVHNSPTLDGPVVYARNLGDKKNRELIAAYPGRSYYIFHSFDDGSYAMEKILVDE